MRFTSTLIAKEENRDLNHNDLSFINVSNEGTGIQCCPLRVPLSLISLHVGKGNETSPAAAKKFYETARLNIIIYIYVYI